MSDWQDEEFVLLDFPDLVNADAQALLHTVSLQGWNKDSSLPKCIVDERFEFLCRSERALGTPCVFVTQPPDTVRLLTYSPTTFVAEIAMHYGKETTTLIEPSSHV